MMGVCSMNNKVPIKTTFGTISGILLTLGVMGIYAAVTNGEIVQGVFGVISLMIAIGVQIMRHKWNEGWWKRNGKT